MTIICIQGDPNIRSSEIALCKANSHSSYYSFAVGERPLPSVRPSTKQKFNKQGRMDRRGGGLVLECNYVLTLCSGVDRKVSTIQKRPYPKKR